MITVVENICSWNAEKLFDVLKKEFANYVNVKLGSKLTIDFEHVYNEINLLFPHVTKIVLTITVSAREIVISDNAAYLAYNIDLLEKCLIDFIKIKAG